MNGTKLLILSIVDTFTRVCLALEMSTHINANTVRTVLGRLLPNKAAACFPRCEKGGEVIARSNGNAAASTKMVGTVYPARETMA